MITTSSILKDLAAMGSEKDRQGMARFGINTEKAFGAGMKDLRAYAKKLGKNHELARELWNTGYLEAQILAGLIAEKKKVTGALMEQWVKDFNSWDVCDQTVSNLFDKHPSAYGKCMEWSQRKSTFEKRAGFAMMATLAVHDKKATDDQFLPFLDRIKEEACDDRNFVKKAVNWALRQIGKRNAALNKRAIAAAREIASQDSKPARWISSNALRELQSDRVLAKLNRTK